MNEVTLIENLDLEIVQQTVNKIRSLQSTLKKILTENHDYGKIKGCGDKPTLLKPGAEKILMALGITSSFEMLEHKEDYAGTGFFAYTIKCVLTKNGEKITEGLGNANSKESKWAYEWKNEKDLPSSLDKSVLKKKTLTSAYGSYTQYQVDADANSKANTILKMAKKRAQIDATLTVASLSEIFTQDFDDLPKDEEPTTQPVVEDLKEKIVSQKKFNCVACGAGISEKIYNFSEKKYGQALCMDCQKNQE